MAYIFDSLGYAKRLRDGGVPRDQAEVHAEAAGDFIMVELATKSDLLPIKADLQVVKAELVAMKQELQAELRSSVTELGGRITELQAELRTNIAELRTTTETLSLRLTVRLGAMMVVLIGALAAILKLA